MEEITKNPSSDVTLERDKKMNKNRKIAILVGVLVLVAYLMLFSTSVTPIIGLFTEVISGAAVIAIAVLMYSLLEPHKLRKPYIALKFVEGLLMFAAGIFILFQNISVYNGIYEIHVYAFSISALFFYILLNKTKLVPRFINIWGMIAAPLVLVANIYTQLGFELPMLGMILGFAPIILNEVVLAFWLIFRGFDEK